MITKHLEELKDKLEHADVRFVKIVEYQQEPQIVNLPFTVAPHPLHNNEKCRWKQFASAGRFYSLFLLIHDVEFVDHLTEEGRKEIIKFIDRLLKMVSNERAAYSLDIENNVGGINYTFWFQMFMPSKEFTLTGFENKITIC